MGAAGFDAHRAAFFQWLGVVPYLTREAVSSTLDFIAGVPDSEVVFDYAEPLDNYPADRRAQIKALAALTASRGEPWLSMFDPLELSEMLGKKGFSLSRILGLRRSARASTARSQQTFQEAQAVIWFGHERCCRSDA